jgi:phage terminase large subunit-like protein
MQAAARSESCRRGTERFAQHLAAALNSEQPGAAARSEALPRDSQRQKAPLSRAFHANGLSIKSGGHLWCGCVVIAVARAVQRSARLRS